MLYTVIATALALYAASKWFIYYCMTRGLLFYVATEHHDELNESEAMHIRNEAVKRVLDDIKHRR